MEVVEILVEYYKIEQEILDRARVSDLHDLKVVAELRNIYLQRINTLSTRCAVNIEQVYGREFQMLESATDLSMQKCLLALLEKNIQAQEFFVANAGSCVSLDQKKSLIQQYNLKVAEWNRRDSLGKNTKFRCFDPNKAEDINDFDVLSRGYMTEAKDSKVSLLL